MAEMNAAIVKGLHAIELLTDGYTKLQERVAVLETFLPILREEYAGKIAGVSGGAASVMETLGNLPADDANLKKAGILPETVDPLVERSNAAKADIAAALDPNKEKIVAGIKEAIVSVKDDRPNYQR